MFGQVSPPRKIFAANRAAELGLPRVDPHVLNERVSVAAAHVADRTLERSRVTFEVEVQFLLAGKGLSALGAAQQLVGGDLLLVMMLGDLSGTSVLCQVGLQTEGFVTNDAARKLLPRMEGCV